MGLPARNCGCQARELPELASPVSAPSLRRARLADALLTAPFAQARQQSGSKGGGASAQLA